MCFHQKGEFSAGADLSAQRISTGRINFLSTAEERICVILHADSGRADRSVFIARQVTCL
ncbi:hypothetical protein WN72_10385 [Bradyrhizobium arachidis]|uniref:Uncharacterized protein n=1 Tax=Bradyrhizobium arachidis TaxID=858423 RepID=A0AAE7NJS7_9BRAD|nr:hypothetical protein WN72_10385 [Bradyrhizobium arachidis]